MEKYDIKCICEKVAEFWIWNNIAFILMCETQTEEIKKNKYIFN